MEDLDSVLFYSEEHMDKAVEFLQTEFDGLRTGKASPALVENITVSYYGAPTRMRDMSNISTPEPRLIAISPFDPSALAEIEKSIIEANIGITPISDGRIIRLPIPELSEERRQEIVKLAKKQAEEQRVAVRNIRRECNDAAKALAKSGDIGDDQRETALEDIQKTTDAHIKTIDDLLTAKEAELMEV